jgi:hypothetical protein
MMRVVLMSCDVVGALTWPVGASKYLIHWFETEFVSPMMKDVILFNIYLLMFQLNSGRIGIAVICISM